MSSTILRLLTKGMPVLRAQVALLLVLVVSGCTTNASDVPEPSRESSPSSSTTRSATPTSSVSSPPISTTPSLATSDRPFEVVVPSGYDESSPAPLVLLLHGYSSTGAEIEAYLQLEAIADDRGMLYVSPEGTGDSQNNQFWDGTDACCNFGATPIDDSQYLRGVIEEVKDDYAVDPSRIYVIGHSNGGFMAHRMACDNADTIAAVVSFAGATFADQTSCQPSDPVSVLQVHGDADPVISYIGGSFPGVYPGAVDTVAAWAEQNTCAAASPVQTGVLDLDAAVAGPESNVLAYSGCASDVAVELWTIPGGVHVPQLSPTFTGSLVDFLLAHPRQT